MILEGDCLNELKKLEDNSIDFICTDPPYGIGFMGKAWDTFTPDHIAKKTDTYNKTSVRGKGLDPRITKPVDSPALHAGVYDNSLKGRQSFQQFMYEIGVECLRVLKPGAFMCMTMTPRQDCLSRVTIALEDAGFNMGFSSLIWTYASGFPKAMNMKKTLEKRGLDGSEFDGAYAGFQPKPAYEPILVAMKPLSEKTYVDQALANGRGISWLDDCRIPSAPWSRPTTPNIRGGNYSNSQEEEPIPRSNNQDRFPANLLVSDDVLNDGKDRPSNARPNSTRGSSNWVGGDRMERPGPSDSGSYSRYFDLDKWAATLPFLITPKASKSEKNKGLEHRVAVTVSDGRPIAIDNAFQRGKTERVNSHPTVKPLKLMSYLITLFSRPGDTVLDPFVGSGTTAVAALELGRVPIGIERESEYAEIARARLSAVKEKDPQLL